MLRSIIILIAEDAQVLGPGSHFLLNLAEIASVMAARLDSGTRDLCYIFYSLINLVNDCRDLRIEEINNRCILLLSRAVFVWFPCLGGRPPW